MAYYLHAVLDTLPLALAAGILCFVLRRLRAGRQGLVPALSRELVMALFVCYLAGLWQLVLFPSNLLEDLQGFLRYHRTIYPDGFAHYLPSLDPDKWNYSLTLRNLFRSREALANLFLFLPFGLLLPLLWPRLALWTVPLGFGVSLAVEALQMPIGRSFDVRDLCMNTLGVLAGLLVYGVLRLLFPRAARAAAKTE